MGRRIRSTLAATAAAGLLLGSSGCRPFGSATVSISARFTESVGLFPGNRVDVLGVPIGRVTKVTPQGTSVLVRMSVPADFKIPTNAEALIIPPSVITDRYLELTPAWTGGPTITAGTEIPLARTRTPVEFDRIVRALDGLSNSLSSDQQTVAAIRDALHVGAQNLKGNGTAIHNSIEGLSAALGTLADNSQNISGLIHSLDGLTAAFAQNDATVRQFAKNVTGATQLLSDNSQSLTATVAALSTALKEVSSFVKDNQAALGTGLADLSNVLAAINAHKGALTEALDVLPLTFQNLAMAINPANHRMRANASAAANILNPVVAQQFCDGFGPFLCANAGKPIGSLSDVLPSGVAAMKRWQRAVAAGAALTTLAGCGPTIFNLPRPGGSVAGPSYEITARFADALNLPDGAHVRVGGVEVGRVEKISTRNFVADVLMRIPRKVVLTDQATAQLRLTTPLGEGFVDIDPGKGTKQLGAGAVIETTATNTAASVEDMLAAASVLITGGGLGQLRTIAVELNKVIDGKHGDPRVLLKSLNDTLSAFNSRTADIDKTLVALDSLSGTLVARRATLNAALQETAPAAKLLAEQTDKFSQLLARLAQLGKIGDRIVKATRDDMVAALKSAQPILDSLISVSQDIGPTLTELVAFGKFFDRSTPGDYLSGDVQISPSSFSAGTATAPGPDLSLHQMMRGRR